MARNWKTVHIFGGTDPILQVIGAEMNEKFSLSSFTKASDFINEMWSYRPSDFVGSENYRIITILKDFHIEWVSKNSISSPSTGNEKIFFRQSLLWFNRTIFNDFVEEIENINL